MSETLTPESETQVVDALQWALSTQTPLEVQSRGTKRALGAAINLENRIELHRLCGVKLYEPDELVLRVGPGTPLDELEEMLAKHGQMLPFEPPRLHGASGSIGGIVGANLAGPRRFKAGAVRDYVIGIRGVSGHGDVFKSGGRVVKNVSGYDLSKLMTGSFGTLAALTEVTFKVLPRPESEISIAFRGIAPEEALPLMRKAAASNLEPSGIAFLPSPVARDSHVIGGDPTATLIRLEGPSVSLRERAAALQSLASAEIESLDRDASAAIWREVRDAALFSPNGALWRVSVPPTEAYDAVRENQPAQWLVDWAGGLVWMRFDDAQIVPRVKSGSGMRVRSDAMSGEAFIAPSEGVARLAKRLKASFDPGNVLNPGRMGAHSA